VVLGAALAGSRTYTASASQGILLMAEVLYNIAGPRAHRHDLRQPRVSARRCRSGTTSRIRWRCATPAGSSSTAPTTRRRSTPPSRPTASPSARTAGDGLHRRLFTLTHTLEPIDIPPQQLVDLFLPPYQFARTLDPRNPISMGTLVSPDHYSEARHSHHQALLNAADEIVAADADWGAASGRQYGGLLQVEGDPDAEIAILTLGSVHGTLAGCARPASRTRSGQADPPALIPPLPDRGPAAGLRRLTDLVVLERALSPGGGGIVGVEVKAALLGLPNPPRVHNFAVGLGGRDIPLDTYPRLLQTVRSQAPGPFALFDVDLGRLPPEDR
jgi:pyruvate ferredoxin oxidoreductase alpha subunit